MFICADDQSHMPTYTAKSGPPMVEDARKLVSEPQISDCDLETNEELLKSTKELMEMDKTPEQIDILGTILGYINGHVSAEEVIFKCNIYFQTHHTLWPFGRNKADETIKRICEICIQEESIKSATLSYNNPQRTIDFFNTPGKNHYLFIRILSLVNPEIGDILGIRDDTDMYIVNYWRSVTAIKKDVPFKLYSSGVGFLFSNNSSVAETTDHKIVWGKSNLCSCCSEGLNSDGLITVRRPYSVGEIPLEKNPIGEKLEEIQKRICGQWPDMTTKELYEFLDKNQCDSDEKLKEKIKALAPHITEYDLNEILQIRKKLKTKKLNFIRMNPWIGKRYANIPELKHNEVLIHPTLENLLGIVVYSDSYYDFEYAETMEACFEANGGPHLPIFRYTLGNLEIFKA